MIVVKFIPRILCPGNQLSCCRVFLQGLKVLLGVFHLPRGSGNSGWAVNGTWFFGSFHWKISRKCRTSEKVVLFSSGKFSDGTVCSIYIFTITTEIHARSWANFYCQYANWHINLKFMRRVSERERAIRHFVIVKNKLMSVFNVSVLLLTMNFIITMSK